MPTASGRASATWSAAPSGTPGTASRARRAKRRCGSTSSSSSRSNSRPTGQRPALLSFRFRSSLRRSLRARHGLLRGDAGEQVVEVGLDLRLDAVTEGADQQAETGRELERIGGDDETTVDAGTREFDNVAVGTFD